MNLTHIRFEGTAPRTGRLSSRPLVSGERTSAADVPNVALGGLPGLILERCGLSPAAYRPAPAQRRIPACVRALRAASEDHARVRLVSSGHLDTIALDTLLIGVSAFFRDPAVFHAVDTLVLPVLADLERPLRVLSIGCSTGEELYSIAILCAERGLLDRSEFFGVDCRSSAVQAARLGIFPKDAISNLEPRVRRHFLPHEGGWRITEALRRRARWAVADATAGVPTGPWDIVLCRNLTIYLQPRYSDDLFTAINAQLGSRGFLVVGKAERPSATRGWRAVGPCVYAANDR